MQDREFRKLLDKYLNGAISDNEKRLLDQFEEELFSLNKSLAFKTEADKNKVKKDLWKSVSKRSLPRERLQFNWRSITSAAAIVGGLLMVGYFYVQNSSQSHNNVILNNVITLELEDGSTRIIDENGSGVLTNKKGAILGEQKGNELVYSNSEEIETLVYNTLSVPFGKTFELHLSDGTKVHLNAGSSLKYPVKFLKGQDRNVFITGEAFLDVAKDSLHPFTVHTDKMNIRVLGTKFNVSSYPEDETSDVVLVEGSVSLHNAQEAYDPMKVVLLKPGFKGSFNKIDNRITKDPVITSLYTSWMHGELIFRNMSFSSIIEKLERHFNVTIINQNKELSRKKFNANFGKQTVEEVLQELKVNYGIDFKIANTGVITIK
ncbi:DUF4974 domain-containing protein [Zobellia galactanivorans]|uniref:FecR family protein n=1 Tax=Zobellia galactanivorans (strain DSM 12802 / CCUG 47099 / CIP 106680 / NCIMB 13871 / Dsij) TaxID=63186 RepID=UPI001C0689E2|nr:FecR domain-containing protein [Zobellia galactanivorans]MBU3026330.1 FecR family protein [Zobellia galactanivorans]MDO6807675.1 DUF4974 domain-containing protein [Zobellia galactanivorans]